MLASFIISRQKVLKSGLLIFSYISMGKFQSRGKDQKIISFLIGDFLINTGLKNQGAPEDEY